MADSVHELVAAVDVDRLRRTVNHLASEPLCCRVLNYVRPGAEKCTLYEADDFIESQLKAAGYAAHREVVPVQAFLPDPTVDWGFRRPDVDSPWYHAVNLTTLHRGASYPREVVVLVAHKDSQSWLDRGPGAYDNAVGVATLLEIARLLAERTLHCSVMYLFCNEEHWPWTSTDAAESIAASDFTVRAVLNIDSIGGKVNPVKSDPSYPNVVRYTTDEGLRIARLAGELNQRYGIGTDYSTFRATVPNDDDGSFIEVGIRPAVLFIGSYPYADPNYHTVDDTPDKVDFENVRRSVQLAVATVLHLCGRDNPTGLKTRQV